jgi:hypothetical protein
MTTNEYLHINQAVKEYGKTRQTFYNYMHKGLVRTKKVNNKVYLNQQDIEQLMSGYIPHAVEPAQVKTTSEAEEHPYDDVIEAADIQSEQITPPASKSSEQTAILKDLARLHQQYYDLKDSILRQINTSKQDLLFDTKVFSQNTEQRILMGISQKMKEKTQGDQRLVKPIEEMQIMNKK